MNYNFAVFTTQKNQQLSARTSFAATASSLAIALLLTSGACKKKASSPDPQTDPNAQIVNALDKAAAGSGSGSGSAAVAADAPIDRTPLTGIDISKLDEKKQTLFYKLVGSLSSPCGKAHSLRTSITTDASCKHAPFAVRYLIALLEDEAAEDDARKEYDIKYKDTTPAVVFKLDGVAHVGATDAPVQLVEFFDYGCPACGQFKPMMDQIITDHGKDFVVYYKMFPLVNRHPDSMSAAQAALAAQNQGKFKEMHDMLFAKAPAHKHELVSAYAKDLGLDLPTFEADYATEEPKIRESMKEGEDAGVESTPTLFFNGHAYKGPMHPKYIGMWIDEALAVGR